MMKHLIRHILGILRRGVEGDVISLLGIASSLRSSQ